MHCCNILQSLPISFASSPPSVNFPNNQPTNEANTIRMAQHSGWRNGKNNIEEELRTDVQLENKQMHNATIRKGRKERVATIGKRG